MPVFCHALCNMALFSPKPCEVVFILSLGKDKGYSSLCREIKKGKNVDN